eukprot:s702_g31.t1
MNGMMLLFLDRTIQILHHLHFKMKMIMNQRLIMLWHILVNKNTGLVTWSDHRQQPFGPSGQVSKLRQLPSHPEVVSEAVYIEATKHIVPSETCGIRGTHHMDPCNRQACDDDAATTTHQAKKDAPLTTHAALPLLWLARTSAANAADSVPRPGDDKAVPVDRVRLSSASSVPTSSPPLAGS